MNVKKFVAVQKYRFSQGYSWIGSLGVGFLVADALQRHYPFQKTPLYVLFPVGVLLVWLIGFVAMRGWYQEEMSYASLQNPVLRKIYDTSRESIKNVENKSEMGDTHR